MGFLFPLILGSAMAGVPAGELVSPAVDVDITPDGFDALETFVPMFLPTEMAVGRIAQYDSECWLVGGYLFGFEINNLVVHLDPKDVQLTPHNGDVIDVHLEIDVSLNDPGNQFQLHTELVCIGDDCNGWVDPFTVTADTQIHVGLATDPVTGALTLDAYVDGITVTNTLSGSDLSIGGCILGDLGIFDLLIPILNGQIEGLLNDSVDSINDAITDALAGIGDQLVIQQSLDLTDDGTVDIYLAPSSLGVTDDGLRLQLEAKSEARQVADCVAKYDTGESLKTPGPEPIIGEIPFAVGTPYHISATIADEFVNQLLYAVWQTGILCQTLGGPGPALIDLPLPMDSSLLSLLAPGVYDGVLPEGTPILLRTRPEQPPIVNLQPDDIDLEVHDLGLEIYGAIDGRDAKIVDVNLGLDAGLSASFDTTTGVLGITIGLDNALSAAVNQNEFAPGTDAQVQAGIEGLLANPAIAGLLDDALGSLAGIGMPPISVDLDGDGIADQSAGVQDVVLTTTGLDDDWMGAYVWVGPVEYEYAGCQGGCGDGCGGSTSSSGCGSSSSGCSDLTQGCDASGCTGGSSSSCAGSSGTAAGGCELGGSGCGSSGSSSCNISGIAGGRALAIVFAAVLIFRRRRAD